MSRQLSDTAGILHGSLTEAPHSMITPRHSAEQLHSKPPKWSNPAPYSLQVADGADGSGVVPFR